MVAAEEQTLVAAEVEAVEVEVESISTMVAAEEQMPVAAMDEEKEEAGVELKQDAEEATLFAGQQQKQEEKMAKLFELPRPTERQVELNTGMKESFALMDKGESQLTGLEQRALMIVGKSGHGKSTLDNMIVGNRWMGYKFINAGRKI